MLIWNTFSQTWSWIIENENVIVTWEWHLRQICSVCLMINCIVMHLFQCAHLNVWICADCWVTHLHRSGKWTKIFMKKLPSSVCRNLSLKYSVHMIPDYTSTASIVLCEHNVCSMWCSTVVLQLLLILFTLSSGSVLRRHIC